MGGSPSEYSSTCVMWGFALYLLKRHTHSLFGPPGEKCFPPGKRRDPAESPRNPVESRGTLRNPAESRGTLRNPAETRGMPMEFPRTTAESRGQLAETPRYPAYSCGQKRNPAKSIGPPCCPCGSRACGHVAHVGWFSPSSLVASSRLRSDLVRAPEKVGARDASFSPPC